MFITKKHLSRRTVLKAAGVRLALPFLEAMVPAATALAQTAAKPKLRTAFFYLPHGAIMYNTSHGPAMDKWTPSGSGADFKLSPILSSLEPWKKYVSSFGNLENAASAGSVHTLNPATWLSATRPDTGGPRAHMATTLDQVLAKVISQDTPLPSLELAAETTSQVAAGGGGSYTTLSFRDAESPLPMEYNPRKVFLALFGEGDTPAERAAIARQTNSILDLSLDRMKKLQGELGPGDRAVLDNYLESVREIERRAQMAAGIDSASRPPQALAEVKLCAAALERVCGAFVMPQRRLEVADVAAVIRDERLRPGRERERERLALLPGSQLVAVSHLPRLGDPTQADQGVDDVRRR